MWWALRQRRFLVAQWQRFSEILNSINSQEAKLLPHAAILHWWEGRTPDHNVCQVYPGPLPACRNSLFGENRGHYLGLAFRNKDLPYFCTFFMEVAAKSSEAATGRCRRAIAPSCTLRMLFCCDQKVHSNPVLSCKVKSTVSNLSLKAIKQLMDGSIASAWRGFAEWITIFI